MNVNYSYWINKFVYDEDMNINYNCWNNINFRLFLYMN